MPACRFPPCFHRKSRRVNPTIPSAAFLMQIKYKRLSPHVPHTSPFFSSVFHAARTLSGSLRSPPSPRGEGFIRRYSFSTYACIRFEAMGEAVFSYRSLPHGGRLTIRDMLFFHLFSCPPGCFCFLLSHSPVFPCARKISSFARNDDTGESGILISLTFPSGSEWRLGVALLHASGVAP